MCGHALVLVTDANGVPVGYTLVAANEKEYEPVRELASQWTDFRYEPRTRLRKPRVEARPEV